MMRKRARRCSATSRCPPPGRSRRSRHGRRTTPHRAAIHPASRRTSGCTTACAKPGCRRNERDPPPRGDPRRRRRRLLEADGRRRSGDGARGAGTSRGGDADRSRIRRPARQDDGRRRVAGISVCRRGGRVRDSHAAADGRTQRGRSRGPTHPLPHRHQSRRRARWRARDILGDGVNIAARLEAICEPGGICISGPPIEQVRGRIETEFVDLGDKALKNIARPVRAYAQVGVADSRTRAKVVTPAAPAPQKRRFGLAPLAAALAALLIVIAGGAWWFLDANRPASVATKTPAEAARLSIVVLPFANLSGDPGQDYLVDALTDELTTSLARIRDSFVIARNTAMTFKGKPVDAKAIGKDLGVRYVLEGSVQPSGDRMRVNAQLIDAEQRRSPLGRTIRHAPRRSVADAGRDRHASGERNRLSAHPGRGRPSQTDARGQSRRRGLGSSMRSGPMEGRIDRQGGGCGVRALRTGARHRSQQCPRPDGIGV